jgi:autotransporter-associated beta strand protein
VDASSVGGSPSLALVPDGAGHYTNTVSLSSSTAGSYSLPVSVTDSSFQTTSGGIPLTVTAASLIWDATVSTDWDASTANWKNGSIYQDGDFARFDDTATGSSCTNVNLTTGFFPGSITVSNTAGLPTADYTFGGTGGLTGNAGLLKQGSGTLALAESGGDNFSGGLSVNNGTLILDNPGSAITGDTIIASGGTMQVGSNDSNGNLPTGSVAMNGTLVFDRTDDLALSNVIGGAATGNLIKTNVNTLTLSGQSTFTGNVSVNNGTVRFTILGNGATSALGGVAAGRTIIVGPGATLMGGQNWFGGGSTIDANYPSIVVNGGTLDTTVYTSLGSVTLNDGATWTNNNSTGNASYGSYQIRGSVTVGGTTPSVMATSNTKGFNLGSNTVFQVADVTGDAAADLIVSAPLWNQSGDFGSATGGLTKSGPGTMLLSATNSYTGSTLINNGVLALNDSGSISNSANLVLANSAVLDVSARTDGTLTLNSNQTLSGYGAVLGSVNNGSGATIAPGAGNSIGALAITNSVGLFGTTVMKLDAAAGTNDQLKGAQAITYGGTLRVTNINGTLAANQTFKLFSAANYAGTFAATILPALNAGLDWNTNNLAVNGTLTVISTGPLGPNTNAAILSVKLTGTDFVIHGTNNNGGQNFHYAVLSSTNLALPLTNWTSLVTNSFNADGTFDYTNPIVPGTPQQFFDTKAVP